MNAYAAISRGCAVQKKITYDRCHRAPQESCHRCAARASPTRAAAGNQARAIAGKGSDITVDAIVQLKMTDRAAYHRYRRAGAQGVVLLAKGFTSGG
jgi:hypothetical protein